MQPTYEYTHDGFQALMRDLEAHEPDVEVRIYRVEAYVEAARKSPAYATDDRYRWLMDQLATVSEAHEEAFNQAIVADLEAEMNLDAANEALAKSMADARRDFPPAYAAGLREDWFLKKLRQIFAYYREHGEEISPQTFPDLTEQDIRDIEASAP